MKLDVKTIVNAWVTSFNPSDDERKLAEDRYSICKECPKIKFKKIIQSEVCTECGCPISKKIFTLVDDNTCPLGKWNEVDEEFRKTKKHKYKMF